MQVETVSLTGEMDMDPVKEGGKASCILQDGTVVLFSWEHALFFKKMEG